MSKYPAPQPQNNTPKFIILQQKYPKSTSILVVCVIIFCCLSVYQSCSISNRLERLETPSDIETNNIPEPDQWKAEYTKNNPAMESNVSFADLAIGDHSIERREKYYDSEYDEDGFPTGKQWLSNDEFKGDHITNEAVKTRFRKRKAVHMDRFLKVITIKAKQIGEQYGIPYKVIVAQAIVESAYGMSRIAVTGYNLFGHKLTPAEYKQYQENGVKGLSKGISGFVPAYDDDPNDLFRQYTSYWVGMERHAQLLKEHYEPNGGGFPECLCNGKRKYATNCGNGYVEKIKSVMSKIK